MPNVIISLLDEYSAESPRRDQGPSIKLISNGSLLTKRPIQVTFIVAISIFIFTFLVYSPSLKNDFVNWDDDKYVYENTKIQSLNFQSLCWMLTSFHACNWHPLTWLSLAIDYAFWGLNPLGYHLTNIIFHGLNALMVFLLVIYPLFRKDFHKMPIFRGFSAFHKNK